MIDTQRYHLTFFLFCYTCSTCLQYELRPLVLRSRPPCPLTSNLHPPRQWFATRCTLNKQRTSVYLRPAAASTDKINGAVCMCVFMLYSSRFHHERYLLWWRECLRFNGPTKLPSQIGDTSSILEEHVRCAKINPLRMRSRLPSDTIT